MRRHVFAAMGCEVVVGGEADRGLGEALFDRYERTFSRFVEASELNAVNAAAGRVVRVSPLFATALRAAIRAAAASGGLVDPTVGAAVRAAGYDRDFADLGASPSPPGAAAPGRWQSVRLRGRLLHVPEGVELDLNGVVKALAVDEALGLVRGDGFVSAGGDLAVRGPVTVEVPGGGSVRLLRGGLATSGTTRRTWLRGGERKHHLIDPRSGLPAAARWEQVTVCGASCLAADVAAKAAFIAGPGWLESRALPGRFVAGVGETHETSAWRRCLERAA